MAGVVDAVSIPRITGSVPMASTPDPMSPRLVSRPYLCGAVAALLHWLAFFPVAWGFLGWIALLPLVAVVRSRERTRTVFFASWLSGLLFFFTALQWMRVADPRMYFTWFLLALYCSFYVPAGVFLVRALDRRGMPLVLSLPLVWSALDLLRAHLLGGFPWYYLGHTQHDFLPIIQIADVVGTCGVTMLVVAVNAVVFEWIVRTFRRPVLVVQSALVLLLFAGFLLYGSRRLSENDFEAGPTLALVQGNVSQTIRNTSGSTEKERLEEARRRIQADYNVLARIASRQRPDLVVYPETSYDKELDTIITDTPERLSQGGWDMILESRRIVEHVSFSHADGTHRPSVLLGLNSSDWYPEKHPPLLRYNSALLVDPRGKEAGRYDKIHRVPFGEYVPLRESLPFMDSFAPYDYDYSIAAGKEQTRLPIGKHRFGVLICYEDTDPVLARRYVGTSGEKADFLVSISNDAWFDGTEEHEQHLAVCRFRAVETRRSMARSVNMGISAVIDSNGRVLAPELVDRRDGAEVWEIGPNAGELPLGRWSEFKSVSGVLFAVVPIDDRDSLYARWGDWLPWTCWGVVAFVLVAVRKRTVGTTADAPRRTAQ